MTEMVTIIVDKKKENTNHGNDTDKDNKNHDTMQKVKLRRCQQNYNEKVIMIDDFDNDFIVIY